MSHIFISYSRKDLALAQKVVTALADNDLDTWVDWNSIPKGEDWWEHIEHGIEEADAFLFLVSPDSVASKVCNEEIDHAVKNAKRILPVILRDAKDTHPEISKRNWIFCRDGQDDFNQSIAEIHETIHTDYEWLQYHRSLQVKALAWQGTQDKSRLLRGKELAEAEERLTETHEDALPTELQRLFVLAGRQHENEQKRRFTVGLLIALLLMIGVTATAIWQWRRADEQATISLSRQLAAQANDVSADNNLRSSLLYLEALERNPNSQVETGLLYSLQKMPVALYEIKNPEKITIIKFSPMGNYFAYGSEEGSISVVETDTGKEVSNFYHQGELASITFSPNGKLLASANRTNTIKVWQIESEAPIFSLQHGSSVYSVLFSPDGNYLLSVSLGYAKLWDLSAGAEVYKLDSNGYIFAADISADGSLIATGGCDRFGSRFCIEAFVYIWDFSTGHELVRLDHKSDIYSIEFAPNGDGLVTASNDGSANTWKTDGTLISSVQHGAYAYKAVYNHSGDMIASAGCDAERDHDIGPCLSGRVIFRKAQGNNFVTLNFGRRLLSDLQFSPIDSLLFARSGDRTIGAWNPATGENTFFLDMDTEIFSFDISPDGCKLVTARDGGFVQLWDIQNTLANISRAVPGRFGAYIGEAALSSDGEWLATSQLGGVVISNVSDQAKNEIIETITSVDFIKFSPDNKLMITAEHNRIEVWDIRTQERISLLAHNNEITFANFSADSSWLVTGNDNWAGNSEDGRSIIVWDLSSGQDIFHKSFEFKINTAFFDHQDKVIYVIGENGYLIIWDPQTRETTMLEHKDTFSLINLDAQGKYILTLSGDNTTHLWDWQKKSEVISKTYTHQVVAIKISNDGEKAIVADSDGNIFIWKTNSGDIIYETKTELELVDVSFSQDSNYSLFSGCTEKNVLQTCLRSEFHIVDIDQRAEIAQVEIDEAINLAAFGPDDKHIVVVGESKMYHWFWKPKDLVNRACSNIVRNLTMAEWQQYFGTETPYHATCDPEIYPNAIIPEDAQEAYLESIQN